MPSLRTRTWRASVEEIQGRQALGEGVRLLELRQDAHRAQLRSRAQVDANLYGFYDGVALGWV